MIEKLKALQKEAIKRIEEIQSMHELNEVKAMYFGKKSMLQEIMATMKDLTPEKRKEVGQKTNVFKNTLENAFTKKKLALEEAEVEKQLASEEIDVTLPAKKVSEGYMHVLSKLIYELEDVFVEMGYSIEEGPEIESDLFNFEMLNLPKDHPARDMQDSFYIDPNTLLRTHTSPVQVRTMMKRPNEPIKMVCPGRVYRRDNDDATHSHQFMQMEALVIGESITMADLKGTLEYVLKKVFGNDREIRFRPSFFPFTEPSVEVDVSCFKCGGSGCNICKGSGWIEVLGAGMVHPNVLDMAGYDISKFQGFAFGIGLERIGMLKYEIDDIRHFYTNDNRFLKQFR